MNHPAPTLKDVAEAADVSVSTASRALAGNPAISEATAQRVRQAADQLRYRPNMQARSLRASRSHVLGLVVPTLVNPYFAAMAAAIQAEAESLGLATLIVSSGEDAGKLTSAVEALEGRQVDAMLVVPVDGAEASLTQVDTPLLLVDRSIESVPSVVSDAAPGIEAAVAHLAARGHRGIGYLSGPQETSTGAHRLAAIRAACASHGLELDVYQGAFEHTAGREGVRQLLSRGATAVIAGDSMMTQGALEACYLDSVSPGADVALVGFDDFPFLRFQPSPVSVIDQHAEELGRVAVRTLLPDGAPAQKPESATVDTRFIARASTDFTWKG